MPLQTSRFMQPPLDGAFGVNWRSRQAAGLRAWFPTNGQMSGRTLIDRVRGGRGVFDTNGPTWKPSIYGMCLAFTRTAYSGITLPDMGISGNVARAMAGWMRITAAPPFTLGIVTNGVSGSRTRWNIGYTATYAIGVMTGRDGYTAPNVVTVNEWFHIAVTYTGPTVDTGTRLFIDGMPVALTFGGNPDGPLNTTDQKWALGYDGAVPSGTSGMQAQLFDFRVYSGGMASTDAYQMFAPETRWELYAPEGRQWAVKAPVGGWVGVYGARPELALPGGARIEAVN